MAADLTRDAAMLVATLPAGPMNVPDVDLEPWDSPTVLKTHLVKPTAGTLALTLVHVPPRLHANQPLEVEFAVRLGQSVAAIERSYFPHVAVLVDVKERRHSVPVSVRLADDSWVARALIHPASWADTASVAVVAFTLAGRSLPCDCLPATVAVGFIHAPALEGAVHAAAKAGDVPALRAALDAGGSTKEADGKVCPIVSALAAVLRAST